MELIQAHFYDDFPFLKVREAWKNGKIYKSLLSRTIHCPDVVIEVKQENNVITDSLQYKFASTCQYQGEPVLQFEFLCTNEIRKETPEPEAPILEAETAPIEEPTTPEPPPSTN